MPLKNRPEHGFAVIFLALAVAGPTAAQTEDSRLSRIVEFFEPAQLVAGPDIVPCTLSGGTETSCFSITVRQSPQSYTPGPWCPTHITDGPEAAGIWFLDGKTVHADGDFITSLADIYGDTNWKLYDPETGNVRFTGTLEACEAAARPDVDPAYQNHCVQCLPEYLPEDATLTFVLPLDSVPVDRPTPTNQTGAGIALNGVRIDGPAPLEAILGAYTIAPFDDCGGHINTHVGYHYHAVTDCLTGTVSTVEGASEEAVVSHGGQIGIAMDGYAIFPHLLADGANPVGLDACYGHAIDEIPYHYHAGEAGSNQNLGCLAAETGCVLVEGQTTCDASRRPPRP
ncbi:YHYH protein [Phaeovulum sp.]|uniref:YHYH protein n=1 Tax=Phaeovulum sp. TaxID=2934796 RepID=UPI00356625FC